MPTNTRTNSSQDTASAVTPRQRRGVESAVDLPVGAALTVKDRVEELARPWRKIDTATGEVKSMRRRFDRELNKVERRGGAARRKATQRAKRTRNRLERQASQRRRRAESTLRTNRRRAEQRFREARARVGERVPSL